MKTTTTMFVYLLIVAMCLSFFFGINLGINYCAIVGDCRGMSNDSNTCGIDWAADTHRHHNDNEYYQ